MKKVKMWVWDKQFDDVDDICDLCIHQDPNSLCCNCDYDCFGGDHFDRQNRLFPESEGADEEN